MAISHIATEVENGELKKRIEWKWSLIKVYLYGEKNSFFGIIIR